jgi:hypothetical protein
MIFFSLELFGSGLFCMAQVLENEKQLLIGKLEEFDTRYSQLEKEIADPAIATDSA